MKTNCTLLLAALLLIPMPALAQTPDTTWCRQVGASQASAGEFGFAADVVADDSGYVYSCGRAYVSGGDGADFVVAKFNEWGDTMWIRTVDGSEPNDGEDIAHAITLDSVGNVYAAGVLEDSLADMDFAVAKFSPSGSELWVYRSLDANDVDAAFDIVVGNGQVYACGSRYDTISGLFAFYVARLNPATGVLIWEHDSVLDDQADGKGKFKGRDKYPEWYEDWGDWENCATAIAIAPDDGSVVATGFGYSDVPDRCFEMYTFKYDTAGTVQWWRQYGRTSADFDDAAFDIAIADDGYIYTAGLGSNSIDECNLMVVRWSSSGQYVGRKFKDDPYGYDEWATAICLDDSTPQNVYMTGFLTYAWGVSPREQIVTYKFNSTLSAGVDLWGSGGAVYGGEWTDIGYDIAYRDGHVYVVGRGIGYQGSDIVLLCYTAANAFPKTPQWAHNLDLDGYPSFEFGAAVCATDTEHVYVGAQRLIGWEPTFTQSDMYTLRYFPTDRDVRADSLLAPTSVVNLGTEVVPQLWVVNEGNDRSSFEVRAYIEGSPAYYDTFDVTNLLPGDSAFAVFDTWTASPAGSLDVSFYTTLAGDVDRTNDTIAMRILVAYHDVGPTTIVVPGATVDSGATVTPQVWIRNYGNLAETFNSTLTIGAYSDDESVTVPAGDSVLQSFASWTPAARGNQSIECVTTLATDMDNSNDTLAGLTFVQVLDIEALSIQSPVGLYDLDAVVTPTATWRNNGNVAAGFTAWVALYDPVLAREYFQQVPVASLAPGATTQLVFPDDTLDQEGTWRARCSTYCAGDLVIGNDWFDSYFTVGGHPDMNVMNILSPGSTLDTSEAVVPSVRIRSQGDVSVPFVAWFMIEDPGAAEVYREDILVGALAPATDTVLDFPEWPGSATTGQWLGRCSLAVTDDDPSNDTLSRGFHVNATIVWPAGWFEVEPMPLTTSGKPVKRGGWLALHSGGMIYATKGYKTSDFYSYDLFGDTWTELADVLPGIEGKLPQKGCKGISDGDDRIFMTKGYNTFGYWMYRVSGDSWVQLTDVPEGPTRKKVKGGTDLEFVTIGDTGFVYMLKGYKTEFWRYNTVSGQWQARADAPTGIKYKWDKGSWIVYDGDATIYAHKAKYYDRVTYTHEFWKYDIPADSWYTTQLAGMPLYGLHSGKIRKKKAKDGGCGALYDSNIWSLKGGNTQQFWMYDVNGDSWVEQDTIPTRGSTGRKKRVKYGADMVYTSGAFWALKGNKTREMWRYGFGPGAFEPKPVRSGVAAGPKTRVAGWEFEVRPNPLVAGGALRYAVPYPVAVTARLYDALGRRVHTLMSGRIVSGRGAIRLDTRDVARGVYLLRIEAGDLVRSFKVVIE